MYSLSGSVVAHTSFIPEGIGGCIHLCLLDAVTSASSKSLPTEIHGHCVLPGVSGAGRHYDSVRCENNCISIANLGTGSKI